MRIRVNNKSSAPLMMVLHLSFSDGRSPDAEIIFYPDGEYAATAALLMRSRRIKELQEGGVRAEKEEDPAASVFRLKYTAGGEQTEEWRILSVNDLWEANYLSSPDASDEEMKELYEEYALYHRKRVDLIRDIVKTRIKAGDAAVYDDLWAKGLITEQEMRDATAR